MLHRLCNILGYALFMPPAILTHLFWSVWGMLAYPLAKLGCDAETIKENLYVVVGPMYVSSKFGRNWNYYGCEPESADDPRRLVIDVAFATRWSQRGTENLRGNETKPLRPGAKIVRK